MALLIVALALCAPVSRVSAQGLPPEVTRAATLTAAHTKDIETLVDEAIKHLTAEPPANIRAEIKQGKEMLLAPLKGREVSVAFRQAYSQVLAPKLVPLLVDKEELRVVNALVVLGELATSDAMSAVEKTLADERPAVRSSGCYAMGRTFDAVTTASPAIFKDRLEGLTGKLADVVRKDKDPLVVLAAVKSLERAMIIDRQNLESVRGAGLAAMVTAVRDRAKASAAGKVPEVLLQALTNAGQAAREALTQNDPRLALSAEGIKQAAELNGHLLALIVVRMQAGDFPAGDAAARELPAQTVSVSETAIGLAAQKGGWSGSFPRGLATEFKKGTQEGDTRFIRLAIDVFGVLNQSPFGFVRGTFLKDEKPPAP